MTKITEYFGINEDFDFNDIFLEKDNFLFVDPHLIKHGKDSLSKKCAAKIVDFFSTIVKNKYDNVSVSNLCNKLNECNETRLGYSENSSQGTGVSGKLSEDFSRAIENHPLINNGTLNEIEYVSVFFKGFSKDRLSDICTRIILKELCEYTKSWCDKLQIPTFNSMKKIHYWDCESHSWKYDTFLLPTHKGKDIIFTPSWFTSKRLHYKDFVEFVEQGILQYFQEYWKEEGLSSLTTKSKDGTINPPHKKTIKTEFEEKGIDIYDENYFYRLNPDKQKKIISIYKNKRKKN